MADTIQSPCNTCRRETAHEVQWKHLGGVNVPRDDVRFVRCCGCGDLTLRREHLDGNAVIDSVTFQPPRLWRRPPDWLSQLEPRDPDMHGLLVEIYSAANGEQTRLLAMGVRAALDHLMMLMLGSDKGTFKHKLDEMVQKGHLTKQQRDNLDIVIDAGSASAHRGFKPPVELLDEMIAVTEGLVRGYYITGPMLNTMKAHIPPRP